MDPHNNLRCQPISQSLRQKKKQNASQDWNRSWMGDTGPRRNAMVKDMKRHKTRISSESAKCRFRRTPSSSPLVAQSLPDLQFPRESIETMSLHLSMSEKSPQLTAKLDPPPTGIDQIDDIFLPYPDVPMERPSSSGFQIDHYGADERREIFPGAPNYSQTQGPLERYLAQDDYVANDNDDQTTNEEFLRLRSLRANALRIRSLLRTKRKVLRDKQYAKIAADEAFMRYVREHVSTSELNTFVTKSDILDALYNAMQETRDIYGPLQDECDEIEENLDDTEFEMGMIEGRIHRGTTIKGPEAAVREGQIDTLGRASPLAPSSSVDFGSDSTEDYHPLHAQYLSRLGDLDLAKETLQEMRQEMQALLSNKEARMNVGLDLHESLQYILAELPGQISASRDEIEEIEKDVKRLHSDCLAAGLVIDKLGDGRALSAAEDGEHRELNSAS